MRADATRTGRVRVAGGELEYDWIGPAAGGGLAPLILLHGWTLDRSMWERQVPAFPERAVIAVDRRGCGHSSAPCNFGLERDDVIALADHLGLGAFILVGMSQAGRIAADLAYAHASRLAGLVLHGVRLGPVAFDSPPDIPLDLYRDLTRCGRLAAMKALWRDHALMRPADPDRQATIDAMLERYDGADLLAEPSPGAPLPQDALSQLNTPTLVLAGDRDTALRRAVARNLAEILPNAAHCEITNAGHMCNLCEPAQYNAALRAFFARL